MTDELRIAAVVPVAAIETAKTRLGGSLDAEERHELVERLLGQTLTALLAVERLDDVVVVSPDATVLELAAAAGARTLRQRTRGLNDGLREARGDVIAGGADVIVIVPIDLPFITAAAIDTVLDAIPADDAPAVVLVTDRHGTGTNLLALRPPAAIDVAFGTDSRVAHREAAERAEVAYREVAGPLAVDLDTPEDLVFIDSVEADGLRVG